MPGTRPTAASTEGNDRIPKETVSAIKTTLPCLLTSQHLSAEGKYFVSHDIPPRQSLVVNDFTISVPHNLRAVKRRRVIVVDDRRWRIVETTTLLLAGNRRCDGGHSSEVSASHVKTLSKVDRVKEPLAICFILDAGLHTDAGCTLYTFPTVRFYVSSIPSTS